jgi:hypothetical protein
MNLLTLDDPDLIHAQRFPAQDLMQEHPLVLGSENKFVVYQIACPEGAEHQGALEYSRWAAAALPRGVGIDLQQALDRASDQPGFYDYVRSEIFQEAVEWHVNFADPILFGAYGSEFFAQDELQVAEHPALAALHEALTASGLPFMTVEDGSPTPVLVTGVERRCRVATERNAEEGRPMGLYGREFSSATREAVQRATTRFDPATMTNLIAMAAPYGGTGKYTSTAYSAFRAAVLESSRFTSSSNPVIVHTGFWGCGAFGGDRILMTILQMVAAQMVRVDRIVFHTDSGAYAGVEAIADGTSHNPRGPHGRLAFGRAQGIGPEACRPWVAVATGRWQLGSRVRAT